MRGGFCMKRYKKIIAILLSLALIISTFGIFEVSAATNDTRYSKKYLQNGGFEQDAESYTWTNSSGTALLYTQPQTSVVPYWNTTAYNTTGSNGKLEFFKDRAPHFNQSSYANRLVAEGKYAAELNADEVSTIYQRIETVSGSTYTWGLDHRGRDTTDTMVLFIGPEQYAADGTTAIDPSKPNKNGQDQFVKMTDWLKTQYGISYPPEGCSQKYTIYSKPFAAKGAFQNESSNADENFSMTETAECNQEWNLWVISSLRENKDTTKAINGWSKYGTNCYNENDDSYNDVINGAGSELGYDCTYTVPKGQTKTLFAFTSYSGGRLSGENIIYDATYGNLLDDINFKLYQPISSSITEGGNGGVHTDKATITSDIQNGNLFYSTVTDGQLCTIRTMRLDEKDTYEFQGAYVTVYKDDGTPVTRFIPIYKDDHDEISRLDKEEKLALSKNYFLPDGTTTTDENGVKKTWDYYFNVSVDSPVHIHMMYSKAPYVLYDSNGGEPYQWERSNLDGGNLIGFRDGFKTIAGVDTSDYYKDAEITEDDNGNLIEKKAGFYKSHSALPNKNWNQITFDDGSIVGSKFLGWAIKDTNNKQVILDGNHQVTYDPATTGSGYVTFYNLDSNGNIITNETNENVETLLLDATHGVTLTAQWQFGYTAQAQTLLGHALETQSWENSDVGGWVEETFINDRDNVTDHKNAYTPDRTERTDAYGSVGEKIIFRATPDAEHNYVFDGWYTKETDGTYKLVTTAPNLAISVEEGESTTYYARFKTKTYPVVFHYSPSGSKDDYVHYEANADNKYGKYFQNVVYNETAVQPTGDSQKVTMWFTSPTERSAETVFDFDTPITKETHLYASPAFTFNYFNYFKGKEPWFVDVYATLKFKGQYIDMKKDADMTDYHIYMLKGTLDEKTPVASEIKNNKNTKTVSRGDPEIKFNQTTNTGKTFNRVGTKYDKFYIFNMKTPVWVLFDFTYKGITYTSAIKDRSLYNDITVYMQTEKSQLFTTYPESTKTQLINAQNTLLSSIQDMYTAVSKYTGIKEPTPYYDGSSEIGLPDGEASNTYEFTSTTSIRNIEPWGLKYTFSVDKRTITDFVDYGAVVLTDKSGSYTQAPTINEILNDSNSLLYSKANNNIYYAADSSVEIYHINDLLATDFDKNTYTVFFVKESNGTYHYSNVVTNSYNNLANAETDDSVQNEINKSITKYSKALIDYYNVKNSNGINN